MAKAGRKQTQNDESVEQQTSAGTKRSTSTAFTDSQIAERAYQIYLERGGADGDPMSDWLQAERELRGDQS
jgi:hypothetical protein